MRVGTYGDFERLEVAELVPPSRKVLDVGCHKGAFGAALALRGSEVWGIEPDQEAAAVAASRLRKVVVGKYPEDFHESESFDCIVFNDVLEHMVDPTAALIAARQHLSPRGYVVASIPNVRNIRVLWPLAMRGRWDYQDVGILDRTHLRFFTPTTMRELFEQHHYQVERQVPIVISPRKQRVLRLLGRRVSEFLAPQFVMVARVVA